MNDVTDAFDPDWEVLLQVTRVAAGSYVNGKWVDGAASNVNIKAIIQVARGDDLLVLPEGLRTEEAIKLHTRSLLQGVSEADGVSADTFIYRNKPWRVEVATDQAVGYYYRAIAIRDNA